MYMQLYGQQVYTCMPARRVAESRHFWYNVECWLDSLCEQWLAPSAHLMEHHDWISDAAVLQAGAVLP